MVCSASVGSLDSGIGGIHLFHTPSSASPQVKTAEKERTFAIIGSHIARPYSIPAFCSKLDEFGNVTSPNDPLAPSFRCLLRSRSTHGTCKGRRIKHRHRRVISLEILAASAFPPAAFGVLQMDYREVTPPFHRTAALNGSSYTSVTIANLL
jgi:hypothetical protein